MLTKCRQSILHPFSWIQPHRLVLFLYDAV
jgi:hypothetical protein